MLGGWTTLLCPMAARRLCPMPMRSQRAAVTPDARCAIELRGEVQRLHDRGSPRVRAMAARRVAEGTAPPGTRAVGRRLSAETWAAACHRCWEQGCTCVMRYTEYACMDVRLLVCLCTGQWPPVTSQEIGRYVSCPVRVPSGRRDDRG